MRRGSVRIAVLGALALVGACLAGPRDLTLDPLQIPGSSRGFPGAEKFSNPAAAENLSGTAMFEFEGRQLAALATDEGFEVALTVLSGAEAGSVHLFNLGELTADTGMGEPEEIDLEGASFHDGHLYVVGSACLKRKKPNKGSKAKNLKRLASVVPVSGGKKGAWKIHSNILYQFAVGWSGGAPTLELTGHWDARRRLGEEGLLKRSLAIPSKENGLDIEGYCRKGDQNYLALRGPVLRGHAVVAVLGPDFQELRMNFLALEGMGIRSIEYIEDATWGSGFYLVAGPTMDFTAPFTLYRWDGETDSFMKPGEGLEKIGKFDAPDPGWKAESLFACGEDLCVAFDGPAGGAPHRVR